MVVLFRTAHPPNTTPCNKIFIIVGKVIAVICSLIVCVFYAFQKQQIAVDREFPIFDPLQIEYFSIVIKDPIANTIKSYQYPSGIWLMPEFSPILEVIKNTNTDGDVKSANIRVTIPGFDKDIEIIGFSVIFKFNVKLERFLQSNTTGYGVFTKTFPIGLEGFSCEGELVLEQKEAAQFRGDLPNDVIQEMSLPSIENLMATTSKASSVYSVDWFDYVPQYNIRQSSGSFDFRADLKVLVNDIPVIHAKPLITFAFEIVIVFLSIYLLASIILSLVQFYFLTLPHLESIKRKKAFRKLK
jgi:hypothetical protein